MDKSGSVTGHELARTLLSLPNLPVQIIADAAKDCVICDPGMITKVESHVGYADIILIRAWASSTKLYVSQPDL